MPSQPSARVVRPICWSWRRRFHYLKRGWSPKRITNRDGSSILCGKCAQSYPSEFWCAQGIQLLKNQNRVPQMPPATPRRTPQGFQNRIWLAIPMNFASALF